MQTFRPLWLSTWIAAGLSLSCTKNSPLANHGSSADPVATITLNKAADTLAAGSNVQFSATLADSAGHPLSGQQVTWTVDSTRIASIDSTGTVTAIAPGTAHVTAMEGAKSATAALVVTIPTSTAVTVIVPSSMNSTPFDVARTLNVPSGYTIAVYTRIPRARFLAVTPDSNLLVALPNAGKIELVRPNASGDPIVTDFVTGLTLPQGMAFHTVNGVTYLYVGEAIQIDRFPYQAGDLTAEAKQVVVSNLPDASTPELRGVDGHALKNIALDTHDSLYVSIASSCNACTNDETSNPVRGAIYKYGADGSNGRLFAHGIRNAEGLAFVPGTDTLWVVVNNRDAIPYPHNDSTGNYGQVIQSYVDNHPPEELIKIRDGADYGWPFCNAAQDGPNGNGYDHMGFDTSYDDNPNGSVVDCARMDTVTKGFQAHSAPLGMAFLQNTNIAPTYQQGALIAFHGSWDRSSKTGYKVIFVPFTNGTAGAGTPTDFVSGWTDGTTTWGRPVDAVVDPSGSVFISDDSSGTVYKLSQASMPGNAGTSARPGGKHPTASLARPRSSRHE